MTITIPTPNKHWLLYPILAGVAVFGIWLWRDTAAKDLKQMAALVEQAKTAQKATDKQAVEEVATANKDLIQKNASLQKQLADAKSVQQQVGLINKLQGTQIELPPQAVNSPPVDAKISPQDIQVLAVNSEQDAENKNQIAADQIIIETQKQRIDARDATIAQQDQQIKELKPSHWKAFKTALKHEVIGFAIGTATGVVIEKKIGH